jgi:ABC-type multidrug transport system ATPase subunit
MSFAIETRNLNYAYTRGRRSVNELSLQVPSGSIYGFLGPNGAGKTTTIRLLTGMLLTDTDNIFINGLSLKKNLPGIFTKMGTLIEMPSLYLHLSGKENLKLIATMRGIPHNRIDDALATAGLTAAANKKAKQYSLGMKQRLGIAMAMLSDPDLLILDEPANGLDPTGIIEVREMLVRLNKESGKTIFVSSHLLAEVEKTCTHIGIIHHGIMRYNGTLEQMKASAYESAEVIFKVPEAAHWLQQVAAIFPTAKMQGGDEIILPANSRDEVSNINKQLVNMNIPVAGIQLRGGLEEWFMHIIDQENDKQIL